MAKVRIPVKQASAARPRPAPDEPCYIISVAAEMVGLHPQTLRQYDRVGLVVAHRSHGKRRFYTPRDIERLRRIIRLTDDLGINLAGVEVILNMRAQIKRMQKVIDQMEVRYASQSGGGSRKDET